LREIHIKRKTVGDILANNTLKKNVGMILTFGQFVDMDKTLQTSEMLSDNDIL